MFDKTILDIVNRNQRPEAWSEGDKIPWNDPDFSARMLREHLAQDHDAASRRLETVERHVAWIHGRLLQGRPARMLDLGCGPGLYAQRLAMLGHSVVGVDFGPASIEYAREQARQAGLTVDYRLGDARQVDFGGPYDFVMMIYGEINAFNPADAALLMRKACAALKPGGVLLLEAQTFEAVKDEGHAAPGWFSASSSLFSDQPHVYLEEHFWDDALHATTFRYYVIDAASGQVTQCSSSSKAYTDEEFTAQLEQSGFEDVQFLPAMGDDMTETRQTFFPIVCRRVK